MQLCLLRANSFLASFKAFFASEQNKIHIILYIHLRKQEYRNEANRNDECLCTDVNGRVGLGGYRRITLLFVLFSLLLLFFFLVLFMMFFLFLLVT